MLKYFLTLGDKKEEKKEKPIEMTDPAKESKPSNDPPPRKPPSKVCVYIIIIMVNLLM